MLILTQALLRQIESHGAQCYPYEGCGLLLGDVIDITNQVKVIFPVDNRWEVDEEKRERFYIAPEDMLRAEMAAMNQGLEVVGVFHSHPDHQPVASPRDLTWAAWAGYSYLITSVRQGQPAESRSWQLRPDRTGFEEEEIMVI